ncbi:LL-diaminopimelate aminotransferase [Clostridia bacterium]|nr:LL-diaminopimelate aminotransferase [Clostridia bacterium]
MATVNAHLAALHASYLFSEIGSRTAAFSQENPRKRLLRLGIGDVTRPLAPAVVDALIQAAGEMGRAETFRGYAPSGGYPFLIDAILRTEYAPLGVSLSPGDIFVSDGAKSDTAAFQELFAPDAVMAVCDPVYPVYADSNAMAGREIVRLPCRAETAFAPLPPARPVDAVYLCSPNNPTGTALTYAQLAAWVQYAQRTGTMLLYDAAYRAYISGRDTPASVYEIPGAKEVAVEFCSLSKSAGFTGLRCAWTVVPRENRLGLGALWARRTATKYNGVAYPVQRAAEAALLPQGLAQSLQNIRFYQENARILRGALLAAGLPVFGGTDAPYLWVRCPNGIDGWTWFDRLLREKQIVCTPGEGFGACGAGYARFSAFGSREDVEEAAARLGGDWGGQVM